MTKSRLLALAHHTGRLFITREERKREQE